MGAQGSSSGMSKNIDYLRQRNWQVGNNGVGSVSGPSGTQVERVALVVAELLRALDDDRLPPRPIAIAGLLSAVWASLHPTVHPTS